MGKNNFWFTSSSTELQAPNASFYAWLWQESLLNKRSPFYTPSCCMTHAFYSIPNQIMTIHGNSLQMQHVTVETVAAFGTTTPWPGRRAKEKTAWNCSPFFCFCLRFYLHLVSVTCYFCSSYYLTMSNQLVAEMFISVYISETNKWDLIEIDMARFTKGCRTNSVPLRIGPKKALLSMKLTEFNTYIMNVRIYIHFIKYCSPHGTLLRNKIYRPD
jgi:hypothetical protein